MFSLKITPSFMMPTVGCHTVEMATRLNNVTVIARRAVVMFTNKVVQDSVMIAARVDAEYDAIALAATLARHPIQGGLIRIQIQCEPSMRLRTQWWCTQERV
jgi:hypothetical protein